jgi:cystathionine beta-lyase
VDPRAGSVAVEHETKVSARLNGHHVSGALLMSAATRLAADKASAHGFAVVGTHGSGSSSMALGYFAAQLARRGLVCLCLAQSPEYVAPHGAAAAVYGTNPLAVGIPRREGGDGDGAPLVLDMATSATTWWAVHQAATAGQQLPQGVAQDAAGVATTDPNAVLAGGALKSFDGSHKGSALALMVEILAGPLVGAAVLDKAAAGDWGNLVIALDPGLLGPPPEFAAKVEQLLHRVKSAPRLAGVDAIQLPGERSSALAAQRLREGHVAIEDNLWRQLVAIADAGPPGAVPPPHVDGLCVPLPAAAGEPAAHSGWKLATRLVHAESGVSDPYAAASPPLYQTATFGQPSAVSFGEYDYTRSGNPTRTELETQLAGLDGGTRGFVFTSGMAALTCVTRLVATGQRVLAGDDIYGGTSRLLASVLPKQGILVSHVDMTDLVAVAGAMTEDVRLVMVESPTNPRMRITDIAGVVAAAQRVGALVCVDNSILAPMYQQPLALGADICMTSATKFVAGHSDVMAGVLTVRSEELGKQIYFHQNAEGTGLAPFDCWLTLRGLKTMALRMEAAQANARAMAAFLQAHPLVRRVNYPGLQGHPGADVHARQASGPGSLLSFETGSLAVSRAIVERTGLFKITVSFGGCSSLISLPCFMSHASIPAAVRAARGLPDDLVRISAGIEDIHDLLEDLAQAMASAAADVTGAEELGNAQAQAEAPSAHVAEEAVVAAAAVDAAPAQSAPVVQEGESQHQAHEVHASNGGVEPTARADASLPVAATGPDAITQAVLARIETLESRLARMSASMP